MNIDSLRYHIARSFRTGAAVAALLCSGAATAAADHSATLVLGQPGFTTNDTNTGETAYTMNQPTHIAIGGGRVYMADSMNNRVLWWNTTAAFSTGRAADGVIGQADFTNNTSGATATTFNLPIGVAVDSSGNVWVADYNNNRVLEFAAPSTNGASAIKVFGQPDFTSHTAGTLAAANNLNKPWAMAFDSADNLWVADTQSNRVLEYNATTISNWASGTASSADKVLGQPDFTSSSNNSGEWGLSYPMGLSFNNVDDLWVADQNNNRVLRFRAADLASWTAGEASSATFVLGQATLATNLSGTTATKLAAPYDVKVDASGNVWVADTNNHRVLEYAVPTTGANATLVLGQAVFTTGTAGISATTMDTPESIAVDASGNVWVADSHNNRMLQYASPAVNGAAADLVLGQPVMTSNYTYWITGKTLNSAFGVTEGGGRVYVADSGDNRVLWWESSTAYTNGRTADGVIGQADLYSDQSNRLLAAPASNTLSYPAGVAVDASGNVWVADTGNHRVLRFPAPTAGVDAVADRVLGQANFAQLLSNRGGGATAADNTLNTPGGVAIDASGNVWVADELNHRILRYPAPVTNGMAANLALGQASLTANASGTTVSTLKAPRSVAVTAEGAVWVSDTQNNRLLKYSVPATGANADMVLGQTDYITGTPGATAAKLNYIYGIAVSTMGDVWVADESNNRVLKFSSPTANGQAADLVLGQADLTSSISNRGATAAANTLSTPINVALTSIGDILVTDINNNRVLKYLNPGILYTVSGQVVMDDTSAPLAGVTVTVSGSSADTAVTDALGDYSFTLQAGGNYTLTPVLSGYSFAPVSLSKTSLSHNWAVDYFRATSSASGFAGAPAVLVSGGPNGYAEPTKGYGATIALNPPKQTGHVTVRIFTQRGARLIKKLEADVTAGTTATIAWDCRNTDGEIVGSGSYLAIINGAGYDNKKITIGVLK